MELLSNLFKLQWQTILVIALPLFVGCFIGAVLYAAIANFRKNKESIGRRVDIFPHFQDPVGSSISRENLTFNDGQKSYKYDELYIVQIQLSNQSDDNFDEFKFGVTLSEGDAAIYIESESPDRHHQVQQLTPLSGTNPKAQIDFVLHPFNQTETYSLRLLMVTQEAGKEPGDIEFSSPHAVKFVSLPTVTEVVQEAARSASLSIGPFSISMGN